MNKTKAKIGDKVTVVANNSSHDFEIGSVVECIELRDWGAGIDWGHKFSDGDDWWWMQPREYTINTTPETGTARELDLQVGDVVEIDVRDGKWHIKSVELIPLGELFGGEHRIGFNEGRKGIFANETFTVISRASTPETGTLAELGVKPGDVVECVRSHVSWWTEGRAYVVTEDGAPQDDDGASYGWRNNPQASITFRIISRAKPLEDIAHKSPPCGWQDATTPQRYVVLTDGDTIICTRSEAEDLAAGGVDAVYKLGDKVTVTVKVELNDEV